MATIYEVARLSGVSPATVSRVFNGASVSPERMRAVREAAEKLQFTPDRAARNLRRRRSDVIALIIPDIENPYFTELARGVEDVMQRAGYSLVMCNTDAQVEKESQYIDIAISEHMGGLILAAASERTDFRRATAARRPVVAVDRHIDPTIDEVVMANFTAGRSAASSLITAGYSKIACITGPKRVETARDRADGWRAEVEGLGTFAPRDYEIYTAFDVESGRKAMEDLLDLKNPPDAVVAANNLIGVGAIQVLTEHSLTPPQVGVAVVGSLPFSTLSPSVVSVVKLPAREMGARAAAILLDRIDGRTKEVASVVLEGELHSATVGRSTPGAE